MRLDGKVNKIERTTARFNGASVEDEKRVFHLNVRLPDPSLQSAYNYGYGQMHFILHGKAMEDFVDLGSEVDIYVVPKGQGDVPNRRFEDMRSRIYELEGSVASLTSGNETLKARAQQTQEQLTAAHQRLKVAMDEVMRLETHAGQMPPAPAQLNDLRDEQSA